MSIDQFLLEIQDLLEEGMATEASDLLSEFLFETFDKPTSIDLPPNVAALPPGEVVSFLSETFGKILGTTSTCSFASSSNDVLTEQDYGLIEETSFFIEARQQRYTPDEEFSQTYNLDSERAPQEQSRKQYHPQSEKLACETELFQKDPATIDPLVEKLRPETRAVAEQVDTEGDHLPIAKSDPVEFPLVDDSDDFTITGSDDDPLELSSPRDGIGENDVDDWLFDDAYLDGDIEDNLLDSVDIDSPVERGDRAWQVAYALGSQFDWDEEGVSLLQDVFTERGWQQAKVAMEYLLQNEMTPEQLLFARQLKDLWVERTDLMIAFYRTRRDSSDYCYLGEQILSWRAAIEIVRRFDGCCGFEEIELFVDDALDSWYDNRRMRASYRTFLQYLRSLAGEQGHFSTPLFDFEERDERAVTFEDSPYHDFRFQYPEVYYSNSWQPDLWCKIF